MEILYAVLKLLAAIVAFFFLFTVVVGVRDNLRKLKKKDAVTAANEELERRKRNGQP